MNDQSGSLSGLGEVIVLTPDDLFGIDCDLTGVRNEDDVTFRLENCREPGGAQYEDMRYEGTVFVDSETLEADSIHGRVTGSGFFDDLALRPPRF